MLMLKDLSKSQAVAQTVGLVKLDVSRKWCKIIT